MDLTNEFDGKAMPDATATIQSLKNAVRAFADERQWEPYHTPKNLSMALAAEVAELMEHFLWLTGEELHRACADPAKRAAIADELADVMNLVCQFSVNSGIDISEAFAVKIAKNAVKYPVGSGQWAVGSQKKDQTS